MAVVPVPREVFEYEMIPWIGREYAAWLRASVRPHPTDEHCLVLVPERIHQVFTTRKLGERATRAQLDAMGYPRLPEEDELEAARLEQRLAAQSGEVHLLVEIHQRIDTLEQRLEAARRAVDAWQRADPAQLEEQIAWELANSPHSEVFVGIPAEARNA
jgi:hypothetical protein